VHSKDLSVFLHRTHQVQVLSVILGISPVCFIPKVSVTEFTSFISIYFAPRCLYIVGSVVQKGVLKLMIVVTHSGSSSATSSMRSNVPRASIGNYICHSRSIWQHNGCHASNRPTTALNQCLLPCYQLYWHYCSCTSHSMPLIVINILKLINCSEELFSVIDSEQSRTFAILHSDCCTKVGHWCIGDTQNADGCLLDLSLMNASVE
jgi:hypothetical protein